VFLDSCFHFFFFAEQYAAPILPRTLAVGEQELSFCGEPLNDNNQTRIDNDNVQTY